MDGVFETLDTIKLEYVVKSFAIMAWELKKEYEEPEDFIRFCKMNLNDFIDMGIIRDCDIIFDETLWLPTERDKYENLMRLYIKLHPNDTHFCFQFDFTQDIYNGIYQVVPSSRQLHKLKLFNKL